VLNSALFGLLTVEDPLWLVRRQPLALQQTVPDGPVYQNDGVIVIRVQLSQMKGTDGRDTVV